MPDLRVLLAFNARSGRGRGARAARSVTAALDGQIINSRACRMRMLEVGPGVDVGAALAGSDVLAIAGGDGSVHHLAPTAAAAGVPIYHIPCGNENLLAREFGMDDAPGTLRRALDAWDVRRMDVADYDLNGVPGMFLLMCSFGPDASVIHRLAAARTRPMGHAAYFEPVLRELLAPRYARLSVLVDGEAVVAHEPGVLLIANSRQYALRVDPASRAEVNDGLLDIVFLPCSSRWGVAAWGLRSRLRRHHDHPRLIYRRARVIEIATDSGPMPFQLDGERPGCSGGIVERSMRIEVRPGALPVLVPPR